MDESIDGLLTYEIFDQLIKRNIYANIYAKEDESMLRNHINLAADDLGFKFHWFSLTSVVLFGNNFQSEAGSNKMLHHLYANIDRNEWCVQKEMTMEYLTTEKELTIKRKFRHDLVVYNLPCKDADMALLSCTGIV